MGILADMDYALVHERIARKAFHLSKSAMHAFWAERRDSGGAVVSVNGAFVRTTYRDVPVIPNDWDTGWEIAEAA